MIKALQVRKDEKAVFNRPQNKALYSKSDISVGILSFMSIPAIDGLAKGMAGLGNLSQNSEQTGTFLSADTEYFAQKTAEEGRALTGSMPNG